MRFKASLQTTSCVRPCHLPAVNPRILGRLSSITVQTFREAYLANVGLPIHAVLFTHGPGE
jgi:hypothetical protein